MVCRRIPILLCDISSTRTTYWYHSMSNYLIKGIHKPSLHPLWYGGASVRESQLLQNVVYSVRLYTLATPRQQPVHHNQIKSFKSIK